SAIRNVAVGGEDGADVEDCDEHEQELIASEERQVLPHTADDRTQEIGAEIGGGRRRAFEAAAEEQAGAEHGAEDEEAVEKRLGGAAREGDAADRDEVVHRQERQQHAGDMTSTEAIASDADDQVDPHSRANCTIDFVSSSMKPAPRAKKWARFDGTGGVVPRVASQTATAERARTSVSATR